MRPVSVFTMCGVVGALTLAASSASAAVSSWGDDAEPGRLSSAAIASDHGEQIRPIGVATGSVIARAPPTPPPAIMNQQAPNQQAMTGQQPLPGQQFTGTSCGCENVTCDSNCSACCDSCCECCSPLFQHEPALFADYLYLRAFGVDMAHGVQQNGVGGQGTVPFGDVGTVQPQFESAFRVGYHRPCDCHSGLTVAYTQYESNATGQLGAAGGVGGTAASLVLVPGTVTAGTTFSQLVADYGIDFKLADLDYSTLLFDGRHVGINFDVGIRYANLDQNFSQFALFAQPLGDRHTTTDINFDGVGLRSGFDGAWQIRDSRFSAYGKGFINVLFGEFSSRYSQLNVTTTDLEANSHWVDGRVVPILEYELGIDWTNCCGNLRLGAGYYTAFWFNTVATPKYIQAVQANSFTNVSETITFTGLVAHAEYRF